MSAHGGGTKLCAVIPRGRHREVCRLILHRRVATALQHKRLQNDPFVGFFARAPRETAVPFFLEQKANLSLKIPEN
jgi:hypothetical protein